MDVVGRRDLWRRNAESGDSGKAAAVPPARAGTPRLGSPSRQTRAGMGAATPQLLTSGTAVDNIWCRMRKQSWPMAHVFIILEFLNESRCFGLLHYTSASAFVFLPSVGHWESFSHVSLCEKLPCWIQTVFLFGYPESQYVPPHNCAIPPSGVN